MRIQLTLNHTCRVTINTIRVMCINTTLNSAALLIRWHSNSNKLLSSSSLFNHRNLPSTHPLLKHGPNLRVACLLPRHINRNQPSHLSHLSHPSPSSSSSLPCHLSSSQRRHSSSQRHHSSSSSSQHHPSQPSSPSQLRLRLLRTGSSSSRRTSKLIFSSNRRSARRSSRLTSRNSSKTNKHSSRKCSRISSSDALLSSTGRKICSNGPLSLKRTLIGSRSNMISWLKRLRERRQLTATLPHSLLRRPRRHSSLKVHRSLPLP
mmetsp:Transcript_13073/g.17659  ORF Transcript_13073/g.17659 Transcript_13073/m.17659 type:complete len:263 (-) Transcript_13073:1923-2711(-)